jgi:hypothetical protein
VTFQHDEKLRLAEYARQYWSAPSHVIPWEVAEETLHSDVRATALDYFRRHSIKWWTSRWDRRTKEMTARPTGHLNSSQVACVNHLEPATTTVIHDEAALASTTEQRKLLDAVETSGARLIEVGDPAQNPPVSAGGLWTRIEAAARTAKAHVKLTRNQRARNPADHRDQARFRQGEIQAAIRGYADRGRLHLHDDHRRAEDHALDAAHADRTAGKSTIVIAQTSNEHLDELNARAQAIRHQHGQLSKHSLPVPGRPYRLHAGDIVQIRRTINHPRHGPCETAPPPTSAPSTPAPGRSTSPSATTTA